MQVKQGSRRRGYHYGDDLLAKFLGQYDKTRDGPRLFRNIHFAHARIACGHGGYGSASLQAFCSAIGV
jgi:hypothetical protein